MCVALRALACDGASPGDREAVTEATLITNHKGAGRNDACHTPLSSCSSCHPPYSRCTGKWPFVCYKVMKLTGWSLPVTSELAIGVYLPRYLIQSVPLFCNKKERTARLSLMTNHPLGLPRGIVPRHSMQRYSVLGRWVPGKPLSAGAMTDPLANGNCSTACFTWNAFFCESVQPPLPPGRT